jgi:peptidylprolyl isomerase
MIFRIFASLATLFTSLAFGENADTMTSEKKPVVVFETTAGNFEVTLNPAIAPKTSENFLGLVKKHYYDETVFHRVIKGFMLQGGDPTGTGSGGESIWGKSFNDEFSAKVSFDHPGVLAMANRGPNTNGSQFFITTAPTSWLNQKHTIFGEVTKGYDVVQKIENTKTGPGDRPLTPQKIIKAYLKD